MKIISRGQSSCSELVERLKSNSIKYMGICVVKGNLDKSIETIQENPKYLGKVIKIPRISDNLHKLQRLRVLLVNLIKNIKPSENYNEARKSVQSRNFIPYCAVRIIEEKVNYIVVLGKHKTQTGPLVYLDSEEYGIGCLDLNCIAYYIEEPEEKSTNSSSFV